MSKLHDILGPELQDKAGAIIKVDDALNPAKAIGLYFAAHVDRSCDLFTPELISFFDSKAEKLGFKIVFISEDDHDYEFVKHIEKMPWYMIPFSATEVRKTLAQNFSIQQLPTLIIIDPSSGKTINRCGVQRVTSDKEGAHFPWVHRPIAELLNSSFENAAGEKFDASKIQGKILGLYFAAHWDRHGKHGREHTKQLVDFYNKHAAEKNLEVIFISRDNDEDEYKKSLHSFPWLSIPWEDHTRRAELADSVEINNLPSLVLLDLDQKTVINRKAFQAILHDPSGKGFPWK